MLDELIAANAQYAAAFEAGSLPPEPGRRLLVLTCMDARIDALAILRLNPGDAHILRNAGGRASDDVVRSIVVSSRLLGVDTVLVMHHTECGMATISDRDIRTILSDVEEHHLESFQLLAISDQQQALRDDVTAIRTSPLLPPLQVEGAIYDVRTGVVSPLA